MDDVLGLLVKGNWETPSPVLQLGSGGNDEGFEAVGGGPSPSLYESAVEPHILWVRNESRGAKAKSATGRGEDTDVTRMTAIALA